MEKENEPSSREASLNMARSLFQEGANVETVMAKTGLSKPACLGLKGSLVKASKRLNARSNLTEAISSQGTDIPAKDEPLEEEEETPRRLSSTQPSRVIDKLARYTSMKDKNVAITELVKDNLRLEDMVQRNDGHELQHEYYPSGGASGEDEYFHELAKTEKISRSLMIKNSRENPGGSKVDPLEYAKTLVGVFRSGIEVGSPKGQDPSLGIYLKGREHEAKNQETAVRRTESNLVDLKLKEMDQTERLDNRKMDWEEKKWEKAQESETQKWGIVKSLVEGPAGELIKTVGGATARKIDTIGQKTPKIIQTTCPACGKSFFTPDNPTVVCGQCGATLAKSSAPAPAPQPQQEPTQPATQPEQPTQAEPVETKPMDATVEGGDKND